MEHTEYTVTADDKPEEPVEESGDGQEEKLLAGKYKTQEDLETAYLELQKKLGSKEEPKKLTVEEPDKLTETEAPPEEAQSVVEKAGLNFDELQNEYNAKGELSEDALKKLESIGIPKSMVDAYIEGMELKANTMRDQVFNAAGGEESYTEITQWASQNLSEKAVKAFNNTLASGDMEAIMLAVSGVKAQHNNSVGFEGKRIQGNPATSIGDRYESRAQVTTDMKDPRYKSDPAFREKVQAKLGRSDVF